MQPVFSGATMTHETAMGCRERDNIAIEKINNTLSYTRVQ